MSWARWVDGELDAIRAAGQWRSVRDFDATGPITKDGDKQNQIRKGMLGSMLNVTGVGRSIREARDRAYAAASRISWPGMHHRPDIAANAAKDGT